MSSLPHVLITGGQSSGKSVLANRILLAAGRPYAGIRSVRVIDERGQTIGFDVLDLLSGQTGAGAAALREAYLWAEREGGVLLIDELDRIEADGAECHDALRALLNQGQVPVVAVLGKGAPQLKETLWAEPGRLRLDLDEAEPADALRSAVACLEPWLSSMRPAPAQEPAGTRRRLRIVVLAAGLSRRFGGQDKLLHPWEDGPLYKPVLRAVAACCRAFPGEVMGVVVANRSMIRREAADLGLVALDNPDAASGQASSVKRGLADPLLWPPWADGGEAAVFVPADQPWLTEQSLRGFCLEARTTPYGLLRSVSPQGRYGSPVSFDRRYFPELLELTGDQGGRAVLKRYPEDQATCLMPDAELRDIDTPADLRG